MYLYSGDPVWDAERHFNDMAKIQPEYPQCDYCEREIEGGHAYEINGLLICPDCLMEYLDGNCRTIVEEVTS